MCRTTRETLIYFYTKYFDINTVFELFRNCHTGINYYILYSETRMVICKYKNGKN